MNRKEASAMYGDNINVAQMEVQTLLENHFNEKSTIIHNTYQYSKVFIEKGAWRTFRAQAD